MELGASTGADIDSGTAGNQDCGNAASNATHTNAAYSESWCAEVAGLTTPTGVTQGSTDEYDSAKGGMRWSTTPAVKWRLPSRRDFEIAEHNGIRHVLPNIGGFFWSASVHSSYRYSAWRLSGFHGGIDYSNRNGTGFLSSVRCVGGP
jgi:hypothetical protein